MHLDFCANSKEIKFENKFCFFSWTKIKSSKIRKCYQEKENEASLKARKGSDLPSRPFYSTLQKPKKCLRHIFHC